MCVENNDFEKEIQQEINKELELTVEKDKLQQVIRTINDEILTYIEKRKEITDYITDYRKKVIEEYRDDEDKVIEYFDHERYVKEEAFTTIDRRLKELTILQTSPYFGRVDFREEGIEDIESMYIGRFGVTPHGSYEPVVVDWRSPASALFYAGGLGKASFNAPMGKIETDILLKRQYVIKKGILQGMFDSAIDVKDDILQMVLSGSAGEKLKDIIMTIQEEQDNLIRQPREKTIVVNGIAGSGKTTIALHRVAYLLYNFRESLQNKVLILGPNNIFMEYISTVLPSLGEVGVSQKTFKEFALNILQLNTVMSFKEYMEKVLTGDKDFIQDVIHKNSSAFVRELDELVDKLNNGFFHIQDVVFDGNIIVSEKEIKELFNDYYKDMPLFRRSKKVKRIIFSKIKDVRDEAVRRIEKEHKEALAALTREDYEFKENSLHFMRKVKIREVIEEVIKVKKELCWLNNGDCTEIYNELNENKPLTTDDLAPLLYLMIQLEGLKTKEEIKHVVIDEAQDYSELQFRVIKEMTGCSSLTIVGDSNQRIVPIDEEVAMLHLDKVFSNLNVEKFNLNKSYRSTKEIMTYANKYLAGQNIIPLVRNGEEVIEKEIKTLDELKNNIKEATASLREKGYESIAIICRDGEEAEKVGKLIKEEAYIKMVNREDMVYSSGVVVMPSYFAKGLEFDGVILINDREVKEEDKLKYVMSTRALHELYVYNVKGISI